MALHTDVLLLALFCHQISTVTHAVLPPTAARAKLARVCARNVQLELLQRGALANGWHFRLASDDEMGSACNITTGVDSTGAGEHHLGVREIGLPPRAAAAGLHRADQQAGALVSL